jgi:hypothetical protein
LAARLGPGLHVGHIAPQKNCRRVHAGTLKLNSTAVEQRFNAVDFPLPFISLKGIDTGA